MKIPENFSNLSSPIMISSMRSQVPSFTFSGQSKVETISPPVNIANEKIFQTRQSRWSAGNHRSLMLKWQTKKFVAVILDFWQAFLNQFWPNFVHAYKIHFWISLVLCVVFKCQYFWSYSRKTHFWPFIYIFQRVVNHSKIVRLTRFFFYRF